MPNKTFNPDDFRRKKPVEPDLAVKPPPTVPVPKPAVGSTMPSEHAAASASKIKMMDSLSLTYEPEWERVLNNVGVTHS